MSLTIRMRRSLERIRLRVFPVREQNKVGFIGLWEEGETLDMGDCFVAYITVNGQPATVSVRATTKTAALFRRAQIIAAVMKDSRADATNTRAVQLIARTKGGQTEDLSNQ